MAILAGELIRVILVLTLTVSAGVLGACLWQWWTRPETHSHDHSGPDESTDAVIPSLVGVYDTAGEAVRPQLRSVLGQLSVTEIPAGPGDVFDPHLHEAVATTPAARADLEHRIAEIVRPGWSHRGHVVRPAQVTVWTYPTNVEELP
ncbi:nucleotide exchange factor GrpE [Smaragdicoccus niigatensis]|uniref:nucleotide exchange factor GrpE n=1 Tax=Smaragdicoccus niigatensis TaxID=359359 RepID=UPI0003824852|nr:nucleotide exchange factor GrpE [Smaragdicoccus niigatensis]